MGTYIWSGHRMLRSSIRPVRAMRSMPDSSMPGYPVSISKNSCGGRASADPFRPARTVHLRLFLFKRRCYILYGKSLSSDPRRENVEPTDGPCVRVTGQTPKNRASGSKRHASSDLELEGWN